LDRAERRESIDQLADALVTIFGTLGETLLDDQTQRLGGIRSISGDGWDRFDRHGYGNGFARPQQISDGVDDRQEPGAARHDPQTLPGTKALARDHFALLQLRATGSGVSRRPQQAASSLAVGICIAFSPGIHAAPKQASPQHKPIPRPTKAVDKRRGARPAYHGKGHSDAVFPADAQSSPAYRYAQLDAVNCYDELSRRQLPVRRVNESWPGITLPVRLTGPLNGVAFRTDIAETERAQSPFELFDCRLILALDDFTRLLRAGGIDEVVFSSAYRPPAKSALSDEQAKRHAGGLAVDIHRFRHADGRWIKVEQDFHGRLGAAVCGKSARVPVPATAEAALLHHLVCGAADQRLFQCILTPNYDTAHRNHFHFELTIGVRWFIVS
jgi:hypothetical protein